MFLKTFDKNKAKLCKPFESNIKCKVEIVLSRGRVVIENGEHKGKAGDRQFIKRGECVKV